MGYRATRLPHPSYNPGLPPAPPHPRPCPPLQPLYLVHICLTLQDPCVGSRPGQARGGGGVEGMKLLVACKQVQG